jgi:hypothetical protein
MNIIIFVPKTWSKIVKQIVRNYFVKRSFKKDFRIIFVKEKIGFIRNYLKKGRGKRVARLGRCIGKNGSRRWVGAGRRDKMKNKKINTYRLTVGNLTKRAKGI